MAKQIKQSASARRSVDESFDCGVAPGVQVLDPESNSSVGRVTAFSSGGLSVQHVCVASGRGFDMSWQGVPYYVALHDLRAKDIEIYADDQPVARERDLRGRLAYIPSGCRSGGWMVPTASPQSFTALFLDPAGLDEDLTIRLKKLPQRARVYFVDTPLMSTLAKLRTCLTAGTPPDRVYAESLCMVAAIELCQLPRLQESAPGMLGGLLTERVIEYIEQNLGQDISLDDLAKIAHMTRFHFLRAFKRATRETPYQFLLRRRIERAQEMLRAGGMSVAGIASAVGFKSSTRLATAFRRITGSTPTAFRAATAT